MSKEITTIKEKMTVRELLNKEDSWIQGAPSVDKSGINVYPESNSAVKWCLLAAINRCYPGITTRLDGITITKSGAPSKLVRDSIRKLFPERSPKISPVSILNFNDHRDTTFEDIVQVIEEAGI